MIELTFQYNPTEPQQSSLPASAEEACRLLLEGNRAISELFQQPASDARHVISIPAAAFGKREGVESLPEHLPYAAVLGCADARVPVELIFGQTANELFVVRVAGNVPGIECIGSLDYAVHHLPTLRAIAVLGHTGCGAVTAAVDTFLSPPSYLDLSANLPLRSIVDSVMASARTAATILQAVYGHQVEAQGGYREALIELSVLAHAAITAASVQRTFAESLSPTLAVRYGIYNLANRLVGQPDTSMAGWRATLAPPPADDTQLQNLLTAFARTRFIHSRLQG